jgi:hypothetical protein
MTLIHCPECHRSISDKAMACPHCGYPVNRSNIHQSDRSYTVSFGYEYKSPLTIFGMPLVHIVFGPAAGGGLKPAKGFIAIGNVAIGVIALGGFALGVISIAGIGLGLVTFAGMAIGLLGGAGGLAFGYVAVGGVAIGVYAIGGLSIGVHTIYNSPELKEFVRSLLGRI